MLHFWVKGAKSTTSVIVILSILEIEHEVKPGSCVMSASLLFILSRRYELP